MKNLTLFLITALLLANARGTAQVSGYTFTQSLLSYGSSNQGAFVGTTIQDDDVNAVVLPFPFTYNGTTYTTVNVCANGYLSFNALTGSEYSALSDVFSANVIAPFAQDMFMGTVIKGDLTSGSNAIVNPSSLGNLSVGDTLLDIFFDFGGVKPVITAISGNTIFLSNASNNSVPTQDLFFQNGSIRQDVFGVTPNRICEFEYRNMTRFPVYDESINFKVRLYESSNKIEFLYGPMIAGNSNSPSEVGLKGSNNGDFNSRSVTTSNSWSTSVAGTMIVDVCGFSGGLVPDNGLSFAWSPTVCVTPTVNITTSKADICTGETATLTATGASSFTWSTGSTGTQIAVSPTSSTTYSVYGDDNGCGSAFVFMQIVTPTPTLTVTQSRNLICKGESATLAVSGAGTFSWSTGSNGSSIVVSPTVSTHYTVTGYNSDCGSKKVISQMVSTCVGIGEVRAGSQTIQAYPNPFTNQLTVENPFQERATAKLFDMLGNVVHQKEIEGRAQSSIDSESLQKGIYILMIELGNEKVTKKLVKD